MAVRVFNGAGDFIRCAIGGLVGLNEGAFTVAALARKGADGGFWPMLSAEVTAGTSRRSFWASSGDQLMEVTGGFSHIIPVGWTVADGWAVTAVTKPAGAAVVRGHVGVLGGAWSHEDGPESFDDDPGLQIVDTLLLGAFQGGSFWPGRFAALAAWKVDLADGALEDGFRTSAAAWLDTAPDAMWLLNQTSTGVAVEDVTGNGADQVEIAGTSVALDDDPPGFDFTIGAATVALTPVVIDLAPVPLAPSPLSPLPGTLAATTIRATLTSGLTRSTLLAARTRPLLVTGTATGGTPPAPALVNVLSNPSLFGWPDLTNTGVPAGTVLTPSGSVTVTQDGTVLDGLDIVDATDGFGVLVQADNVTIRRCRIATTPLPGGGCVLSQGVGLLVEDCELTYTQSGPVDPNDPCIHADNYTLRRCLVHHVTEGLRVGSNVLVEDCYIHRLLVESPEAHADCLQTTAGSGIVVRHNTIVADQTGGELANSAYICGNQLGATSGVQIIDNLLDGGGFTLFLGPNPGIPMSDVTVRGNRWGRLATFGPHSVAPGIDGLTWEANVWDDGSGPVPDPT